MRKKLSFLLLLALVLGTSVFSFGVPSARADLDLCAANFAGTATENSSAPTNNNTQYQVKFTLDADSMACWKQKTVSLDMKYQKVDDLSSPGVTVTDSLANGEICTQDNPDTNDGNDPNFTCTTDTLASGNYVYALYLISLTGLTTQHITPLRSFTITSPSDNGGGVSVTFGSVSANARPTKWTPARPAAATTSSLSR